MKNININDIINISNGDLLFGDKDFICDNFSNDTRNIKENDIYIGIKGNSFDGNLLFDEAFNKGAKACILEKDSVKNIEFNKKNYKEKIIILVDNSLETLQKIASYKRSLYNIPVIAITGSVGKTSTKEIISNVLSTKYKVLKTEGNYNNHIGLPLTILKLKNHEVLVLEMGMNHFDEIKLLTNIAKPDIAVITNIGTAHIGNLGSRENILKAKLEIIDGLNNNGTLIVNNDNDLIHSKLDQIKNLVNIITVGIKNDSNYLATDIQDNIFSSKFKINNYNFEINAPGDVFIYNSLIAYAVAKELNIDNENINKGLYNFKLPSNRLEKIINKKGTTIINDSYNSSYDSLINSIDMICKTNYNRKILMIGDILELGGFSKKIHTKIGQYILNKDIDSIILIGEDVKYIKNYLEKNKFDKDIFYFEKEYNSYEFLNKYLNNNDIILIKGSHGINLNNVVNYLKQV